MEAIRQTERDEAIDLHAGLATLRETLGSFITRDGDALLVAGGLRVGTEAFGFQGKTPAEVRQQLSEASSKVREQADAVGVALEEDRMASLEAAVAEESPIRAKLGAARELLKGLEEALEAIALLEETPAVELDLKRVHGALEGLATQVDHPMSDPLEAVYATEITIRL